MKLWAALNDELPLVGKSEVAAAECMQKKGS